MHHVGTRPALLGLWLLLLSSLAWAQQPEGPKPVNQPSEVQADVAALRARVTAFWEARVNEDTVAEYQFLEPRVRRRMRVEAFLQGRGIVRYREYAVEAVAVEEPEGVKGKVTVHFVVEVRPPIPQGMRTAPARQEARLTEEWVKVGDQWYRRWKQAPENEGGVR